MILVPFVLISVTLTLLVRSILQKYYALLFAPTTKHDFQCTHCQTEYTLDGPEAKKSIRPNVLLIFPKKKHFVFSCVKCNAKAKQVRKQTSYSRY